VHVDCENMPRFCLPLKKACSQTKIQVLRFSFSIVCLSSLFVFWSQIRRICHPGMACNIKNRCSSQTWNTSGGMAAETELLHSKSIFRTARHTHARSLSLSLSHIHTHTKRDHMASRHTLLVFFHLSNILKFIETK